MPLFERVGGRRCAHVPVPRIWRPSGLPFEARLEALLARWQDTPYLRGQQCEGVGVDCVRFVCAVWDDLIGRPRQPIERLPSDMAMNAPETARAAMRRMTELYGPFEEIEGPYAEPGDFFVTGGVRAGPGHAIIVGARRNTIWQAGTGRVAQGGWSLIEGDQELLHHKRFLNRHLWPAE
jgi:cell wall-associated NlpC family hydrolase